MFELQEALFSQVAAFQVALAVTLLLLAECLVRIKELRAGICALVLATIGLWYFVDPVYRPAAYADFTHDQMQTVYLQVLIFLVAFRLLIWLVAPPVPVRALRAFDPRELSRGRVVGSILLVWVILFAIGMTRANFDFLGTLLPLQSRAAWGRSEMWARPRFGGSFSFLISAAGYSYLLCCASFGVISVATRSSRQRWLMFGLMLLTWPMFMLSGTRSNFLAVVMPLILSVLFLRRWSRGQQLLFLGGCLIAINFAMLVTIASREKGFDRFFSQDDALESLGEQEHEGLNMPEELVYINAYQESGLLEPEWGYEYFSQAVNFIPRAVWPGKPFPGEKFSALRVGYLNGEVAATISNGLVGQGVQNFGRWLGPVAPAVLLSLLARWLCRFPLRGNRFLRAALTIFTLALIPNLGRDITLFTLWPVIFGALGIYFYEKSHQRR